MLGMNSTGQVSWVIIPTPAAAPAGPAVYYVNGTLTYSNAGYGFRWTNGPVGIRVLPQAHLAVDFFHQRDVYSDDPFTDAIEPPVDFTLAALVRNLGPGMAWHLRMELPALQIVENQQGLAIDFTLVGSQVGTQPMSGDLTLNFGSLTNGELALGRWLMRSSLQGLFTEYSARIVLSDDLGDRRLAFVDRADIHELIHLVRDDRPGADALPDFLVNELPDPPLDLPDTLYLSDGRTNVWRCPPMARSASGPPRPVGSASDQRHPCRLDLLAAARSGPRPVLPGPRRARQWNRGALRELLADRPDVRGRRPTAGARAHPAPARS